MIESYLYKLCSQDLFQIFFPSLNLHTSENYNIQYFIYEIQLGLADYYSV